MVARKIPLSCLFLINITNGYTNPPKQRPLYDGILFPQARGQERKIQIHWPSLSDPVPIEREIQLLMSGNLVRRGEFGPLLEVGR
jgi:hypothetical protein